MQDWESDMNRPTWTSEMLRPQRGAERRAVQYSRVSRLARRLSSTALTLGVALALAGVSATPAHAQKCRSSSYLPGLRPLVLRHSNGTTIKLQRDSRNYVPTAHVWINGRYAGEHSIPFSLAHGQIRLRLRTEQRLETWLGKVRQAYKSIPYVVVCGSWRGDLE